MFFNCVAGLFKGRQQVAAAVLAASPPVAMVDRAAELRARIAEYVNRPTFRARGYLTATHRTSHRTVAMDLRDAKKRRHIAKRNKTAQHNGKRK